MWYKRADERVEAIQMTREMREHQDEWPDWLWQAWDKPLNQECAISCEDYPRSDGKDQLIIRKGNELKVIRWDHWIVKEQDGRLMIWGPGLFAAKHEVIQPQPHTEPSPRVETSREAEERPCPGGTARDSMGSNVASPSTPPSLQSKPAHAKPAPVSDALTSKEIRAMLKKAGRKIEYKT